MKSRILRRAGALLLALTLACSLLVIPAAADTPVSSISLNVADCHFSAIGQTYQLSATIQPQDATNQALEWSSDNPPVATVSSTGLITSIAPGSATITVRAQDGSGVQASCTVHVLDSTSTPPAVTGVTVSPKTVSVAAGGSTNLSASVQPDDADQSVRWSVSPRSSPVTVSSSGSVSVPSNTPAGTVTIRATSDADTSKSDTCTLTVTASSVTPPSSSISLTLDRTSLSLAPGESATLASEVTGSTNQYVTWRSENDALVQVNTNGKVTVSPNAPVGRTVTITAVAAADPRATAFCVVSIVEARPPKVTNVAITSPGTDDFKFVDPGKTFQLKATVTVSKDWTPDATSNSDMIGGTSTGGVDQSDQMFVGLKIKITADKDAAKTDYGFIVNDGQTVNKFSDGAPADGYLLLWVTVAKKSNDAWAAHVDTPAEGGDTLKIVKIVENGENIEMGTITVLPILETGDTN